MEFYATHTIIIKYITSGQCEKIPVRADEYGNAEGPLYTREEWEADTRADWEYVPGEGLCFQGKPGGPYNFATYEIVENATG